MIRALLVMIVDYCRNVMDVPAKSSDIENSNSLSKFTADACVRVLQYVC